jgi:predicted DNA-binding antitoxin AbrB/MazE fold protein
MTQITEAVYADGVLRPISALSLHEQQHVRIIVEPIEPSSDREAALARLEAGIAGMQFLSNGPLPSREALHERS